MRAFRSSSAFAATPPSANEVRAIVTDATRPGNFFASPDLRLEWSNRREEIFWESFRGHALDHTKTRRKQAFESWNVAESGGDEPLISVKLDAPGGHVFVTRSILCRTFEGYVENGEALSRETTRRVRELVGAIDLSRGWTAADVHDELVALLFHAFVGTSRLPLTSLEAPLPEFTFGQLANCYRRNPGDAPMRSIDDWLSATADVDLSPRERSCRLEFAIRAGATPPVSADMFRTMFNDVALSPYTEFVSRAIRLLDSKPVEERVDLLTHLLRQNARHLTSFDLVRFHHRGANYPDALLLEEVFAEVSRLADAHPQFFLGDGPTMRLRRRAIRQAWLIRRQYRDHLVPDAPTSPGENARVLQAPFGAVPEEQILDPMRRTRRLFADSGEISPTIREVLRQSIRDLAEPIESRELGVGLFLDRPLGFAKARGEPDATIMLSHVAFSAEIARQRLAPLREIDPSLPEMDFAQFRGVSWYSPLPRRRPGVVSVQDAQNRDWLFLHTTRSSLVEFCEQYDFGDWRDWLLQDKRLILPSPERAEELLIYDEKLQARLRASIDVAGSYTRRAGTEYAAIHLACVP
jgi:hypothetical protein